MTKQELIKYIKTKTGYTSDLIDVSVENILDGVIDELKLRGIPEELENRAYAMLVADMVDDRMTNINNQEGTPKHILERISLFYIRAGAKKNE